MRGIERHDTYGFPGPNLQKLVGVCLGPINGISLFFLIFSYVQTKKTINVLG
jgi:hypothetical protein